MKRTILPSLLVALALLVTPAALAQVTTAHPVTTATQTPTTEAEIEHNSAMMSQTMARMDRDFQDFERRLGSVRDQQARTAAQQRADQMRTQRETLRTDMDALGTLEGDEALTRQREVRQRMDEMDSALFEARLGIATTRDTYRQMTADRLRLMSDRLNHHSERLGDIPRENRAEAAYEMIQLRTRHDALARQHRDMARSSEAAFGTQRDAYTRDWTEYERDVLQAEGALMHHHTAQGATPPTTQPRPGN